MGKFYGRVGYAQTLETSPGVWEDVITERNYSGDVLKVSRRLQATDAVNDDITVTNEISILSDGFAYENFHAMRYVEWMGTLWKVTKVDVQRPRLTLGLGGVYNGPKA